MVSHEYDSNKYVVTLGKYKEVQYDKVFSTIYYTVWITYGKIFVEDHYFIQDNKFYKVTYRTRWY